MSLRIVFKPFIRVTAVFAAMTGLAALVVVPGLAQQGSPMNFLATARQPSHLARQLELRFLIENQEIKLPRDEPQCSTARTPPARSLIS